MHYATTSGRLQRKGLCRQTLTQLPTTIKVGAILVMIALILGGCSYSYTSSAHADSALKLGDYRLAQSLELEAVADNASGLSYCAETDTLFAVLNNPETLLELSKSGELLRSIELRGFHDTESVISLGAGRFAIVEERRSSVVLVTVDANTEQLERSDFPVIGLGLLSSGNNKGLEGGAFDAEQGILYLVNEKAPRRLISVSGLTGESMDSVNIQAPWSNDRQEQVFLDSDDYSGLHFDADSRHLLMLSHESRELVELDEQGAILSRLDLSWWHRDLTRSIPQPEGVTMDPDGNVYFLSEPNLFYRFEPGHTRI